MAEGAWYKYGVQRVTGVKLQVWHGGTREWCGRVCTVGVASIGSSVGRGEIETRRGGGRKTNVTTAESNENLRASVSLFFFLLFFKWSVL